jgi:hypothetical protein
VRQGVMVEMVWWRRAARLMLNWKQRDMREGPGRDRYSPQGPALTDLFLQPRPTSKSLHHLPIMPSNYESIGGLINWLGHDPVTSQGWIHQLGTKLWIWAFWGNNSYPNHNTNRISTAY